MCEAVSHNSQAEAEEEAAFEPHGLGFKAGAVCSYDSLRRHDWQQHKQQQSTYRNRRLLKPSLNISFHGSKFGCRICAVENN